MCVQNVFYSRMYQRVKYWVKAIFFFTNISIYLSGLCVYLFCYIVKFFFPGGDSHDFLYLLYFFWSFFQLKANRSYSKEKKILSPTCRCQDSKACH